HGLVRSLPARRSSDLPDVSDRRRELDVAHALTAHRGLGDLDAAALAHDPLEPHALVLAARALPVTGRAEDLLTEQTVLLRLQGADRKSTRLNSSHVKN